MFVRRDLREDMREFIEEHKVEERHRSADSRIYQKNINVNSPYHTERRSLIVISKEDDNDAAIIGKLANNNDNFISAEM